MLEISEVIASSFFVGSSMQRLAPLKTHPSISFLASQVPSSSSSFLSETGSPPVCFVILGGGIHYELPAGVHVIHAVDVRHLMSGP